MGGFKPTLINEIEKLYKKKKVMVAAILSIALIIFGQLTILGLRSGLGLRGVGSMEFPLSALYVVTYSLLPLFTTLVTIDSFSSEFSNNTMKITLTRPVTRFRFLVARLAAIMLFVLTNLLFVMISSLIAGILFNANTFSFLSLFRVIISYLVTMLPMLVIAVIVMFLTNIIRSGSGVFFLSIIIFIGFKVLSIIYFQYSALFFTSTLDWYKLWIMDSFPLLKIIRLFLLMSSYVIILFTGVYYLFDKRDF